MYAFSVRNLPPNKTTSIVSASCCELSRRRASQPINSFYSGRHVRKPSFTINSTRGSRYRHYHHLRSASHARLFAAGQGLGLKTRLLRPQQPPCSVLQKGHLNSGVKARWEEFRRRLAESEVPKQLVAKVKQLLRRVGGIEGQSELSQSSQAPEKMHQDPAAESATDRKTRAKAPEPQGHEPHTLEESMHLANKSIRSYYEQQEVRGHQTYGKKVRSGLPGEKTRKITVPTAEAWWDIYSKYHIPTEKHTSKAPKEETMSLPSSKKETVSGAVSGEKEPLSDISPKKEPLSDTAPKKEHVSSTSQLNETVSDTSSAKELVSDKSQKKETESLSRVLFKQLRLVLSQLLDSQDAKKSGGEAPEPDVPAAEPEIPESGKPVTVRKKNGLDSDSQRPEYEQHTLDEAVHHTNLGIQSYLKEVASGDSLNAKQLASQKHADFKETAKQDLSVATDLTPPKHADPKELVSQRGPDASDKDRPGDSDAHEKDIVTSHPTVSAEKEKSWGIFDQLSRPFSEPFSSAKDSNVTNMLPPDQTLEKQPSKSENGESVPGVKHEAHIGITADKKKPTEKISYSSHQYNLPYERVLKSHEDLATPNTEKEQTFYETLVSKIREMWHSFKFLTVEKSRHRLTKSAVKTEPEQFGPHFRFSFGKTPGQAKTAVNTEPAQHLQQRIRKSDTCGSDSPEEGEKPKAKKKQERGIPIYQLSPYHRRPKRAPFHFVIPADADKVVEEEMGWNVLRRIPNPFVKAEGPQEQSHNRPRKPHLNRLVIETHTRVLVKKLMQASTMKEQLAQVKELAQYMKEYPSCRHDCFELKTVPRLLSLMQMGDKELTEETLEALALLGYSQPVRGRGIRILCLDGGGTRALVPIYCLKQMEQLSNRKIHELFDYVCGVSTGALLASIVFLYRIPLDECEQLYIDFSQKMFSRSRVIGTGGLVWNYAFYDSDQWEEILQQEIGDKTMIEFARDPLVPKVAAVSTLLNTTRLKRYMFRTYNFPPSRYSHYPGSCTHKLWEMIRASSAAPGYYEDFCIGDDVHSDGGLLANNPTAVAIHESRLLWPDEEVQCVVSLGTGRHEPINEPGKCERVPLREKISKMVDNAADTEATHVIMEELMPPNTYFRFNPYLSELVPLDEIRQDKLRGMKRDTAMYLRKNGNKVQKATSILQHPRMPHQHCIDWLRLKADTLM